MRRFALTFGLALAVPLIFSACATIGPPQPPSLDLPKPPTDLKAVRKGDRVILTWTIPSATTDRQTIRSLGPIRICRGLVDLKMCGTPVGTTNTAVPAGSPQLTRQKIIASYTDTLPQPLESDSPTASVTYAVEVLNRDGRSAGISNLARASLIRTLPPPPDFRAQVTSQGIVLSWTNNLPPANPALPNLTPMHYAYRFYRRQEGTQQSMLVGEVPAGSNQLRLTDSSFEWEKTYEYHVETVTVLAPPNNPEIQVEGEDSHEVRVFANDVFPPAVPSGLQAVFSGPGQQPFIDLIWAPVPDVDLAGYNIYRHEEGAAPTKLNTDLVKTPAYRDSNVTSGKRYIYSVSAVDVRGNESARSEEATETVP